MILISVAVFPTRDVTANRPRMITLTDPPAVSVGASTMSSELSWCQVKDWLSCLFPSSAVRKVSGIAMLESIVLYNCRDRSIHSNFTDTFEAAVTIPVEDSNLRCSLNWLPDAGTRKLVHRYSLLRMLCCRLGGRLEVRRARESWALHTSQRLTQLQLEHQSENLCIISNTIRLIPS